MARAILRNDGEAEDVMQDAYVRAYEHRDQFAGRAKFSTWLTRIAVRLASTDTSDKNDPGFWVVGASETFCPVDGHCDRGIFLIYLLNLVHLRPGQGTFQPAGTLHAYLEGVTVELMANSDNVLRGGLTPKHVDVPVSGP
jgi:mannose-6-phosphate isomerase